MASSSTEGGFLDKDVLIKNKDNVDNEHIFDESIEKCAPNGDVSVVEVSNEGSNNSSSDVADGIITSIDNTIADGGSANRGDSISSPTVNGSTFISNISILKYPYQVVDTEEKLIHAVSSLSNSTQFSLDIEAFCTANTGGNGNDNSQRHLGTISLIQCCSITEPVVFLIDVVTLTVPLVLKHIKGIMTNGRMKKLMFDCRRDVEALSVQMQLKPVAVLDLQLFYTALQWRSKSVNRRSGMSYVIKNECDVTRQEGDSAVQAAMTLGNRPVWDMRPLPPHFLEYAAGDVRHILVLAQKLTASYPPEFTSRVERLTAQYVDHYAVEQFVEIEADPKPHDVSVEWLERFIGPGGKCSFCGAKGHTDAECFKRQSNVLKCSHCNELGHIAKNCYRKFPHLLKCDLCGQIGHNSTKCFQRNRCKHCGGMHRTENCHQYAKQQRRAEMEAENKDKREKLLSNKLTSNNTTEVDKKTTTEENVSNVSISTSNASTVDNLSSSSTLSNIDTKTNITEDIASNSGNKNV